MTKRKNDVIIDFSNAESSEHVTGSCYFIKTKEIKVLLECGLAQSNNMKKDYYTNKEGFNFKPKEIDYLLFFHVHLDHVGRAPLLFKRGFKGKVLVPLGSKSILKDIYQDSIKIMSKDAATLSIQTGREYEPLYGQEEVNSLLENIIELDFNTVHKINDYLKIKYTPSGHIIHGAQGELWITSGNTTKKIIYTSDLGNCHLKKHYVDSFVPLNKANLLIGETTYCDAARSIANEKSRLKDIEKIKEVIINTCVIEHKKVLIPVFALDRSQTMITILYELFGKDTSFNIPIILDSPLGLKHFKSYFASLEGEELNLLKEVMTWKNVIQVKEWSESNYWANNYNGPCIILASSGMMQNGRIVTYLPSILKEWNNHILFCGYLSENSLGWKIKNSHKKRIKINGEPVLNACRITSLNSFSSHMQYDSLLKYYSDIDSEKIVLVHGQMDSKIKFKEVLQKELSKKGKVTKVTVANKSTVIHL